VQVQGLEGGEEALKGKKETRTSRGGRLGGIARELGKGVETFIGQSADGRTSVNRYTGDRIATMYKGINTVLEEIQNPPGTSRRSENAGKLLSSWYC